MKAETIRPIAICVCRHGNRILVMEGYDSRKKQVFYRPLGGSIEFGEHGEETVRREFLEEIGAQLSEVKYLGMLENIFTFEGQPGHEIVLIYDGLLCDPLFYQKEYLHGNELGGPFKALWLDLDGFDPKHTPLYPDGLGEMLR